MLLLLLLGLIAAASIAFGVPASPLNPPKIPLIVKSPFLSAWLPNSADGRDLCSNWPTVREGGDVLGWAGFIRVDGTSYRFMGAYSGPRLGVARQISVAITPTQTIFVFQAGAVSLTARFFSPIEPSDYVKLSLPFSYLSLSVASTDGNPHHVAVYTDISGEWLSGERTDKMQWSTTISVTHIHHHAFLQAPTLFEQSNLRSLDSTVWYGIPNGDNVTHAVGADTILRDMFNSNGMLNNSEDAEFRGLGDRWPVLAFAQTLGPVMTATEPIVFAIGLTRDPIFQYAQPDKVVELSPYWRSAYPDVHTAMGAFLKDYKGALDVANKFDEKVGGAAAAISAPYAGIVALATRQAFGAIELTVSKDASGRFNTSDTRIFFYGGDEVSTVDMIFPSFPIWIYTNPLILRDILRPIFEFSPSAASAPHDIGNDYPKALRSSSISMPVEESANMLLLTAIYSKAAGDKDFATANFNTLQTWAQYLVTHTLRPESQPSSDRFQEPLENQTNLAAKGIIALAAWSQLTGSIGRTDVSNEMQSFATDYANQWQNFALSEDKGHYTLQYGNTTSWVLLYNLFADRILKTNIFPESVADLQANHYNTVSQPFGIPLDSRTTATKSDWLLFTAATVNTTTRDTLVGYVHGFLTSGKSEDAFPDLHNSTDGSDKVGGWHLVGRGVVGAAYSLLVKDMLPQVLVPSTASPAPTSSATSPPTGSTGYGRKLSLDLSVSIMSIAFTVWVLF